MHTQKCLLTTNPIQDIFFGEVTSLSDSQEITRILSKPSLHLRVYGSRPLVVSPTRLIQATTFYRISSRFILILTSHQRLGIQCRLFASDFPTKIFCAFLFSSKHNTWPTLLYRLYSITWLIFSEKFKQCKSSPWNFLHSPVTSSRSETYFLKRSAPRSVPFRKILACWKSLYVIFRLNGSCVVISNMR